MKEREKVSERFASPVVWVAILTAVYTYVEITNFNSPKEIALAVIGILIAAFSAINDPTAPNHI